MYADYFGLKEAPFSIAPDPRYLYLTRRHKDALAHLFYGIRSEGGFILLTGEVGTGKTTLCRCLLEQIPESVETAFVLNPLLTVAELLATICDEFGITYPETAGVKILVDRINAHLLASHAAGKRCVLIIDEAQNLSTDVLEQLRLLTNLETNQKKLLQIILLGQPELLALLNRKELRQLNQRVTARNHLEALDFGETCEYVKHRLDVAGGDARIFSRAALKKVFRLSRGIPRVINLICDRALLGAYATAKTNVSPAIVARAASEALGKPATGFYGAAIWATAAAVALLAFGFAVHERFIGTEASKPVPVETQAQGRDHDTMANVEGHENVEAAYHDLFALWGTAFEDRHQPPCRLAADIGLGCHRISATLNELRRLDRPVIVKLDNGWLTLSALSDSSVTLIAGDRQFELDAEAFQAGWKGDVRLLWRMPPDYSAPLKLDDRGAAVNWLVSQLAVASGSDSTANSEAGPGQVYNEEVAQRVMSFQASIGLPANGIVDITTWMHLNNVTAVGVPTLANPRAKAEQG